MTLEEITTKINQFTSSHPELKDEKITLVFDPYDIASVEIKGHTVFNFKYVGDVQDHCSNFPD